MTNRKLMPVRQNTTANKIKIFNMMIVSSLHGVIGSIIWLIPVGLKERSIINEFHQSVVYQYVLDQTQIQ